MDNHFVTWRNICLENTMHTETPLFCNFLLTNIKFIIIISCFTIRWPWFPCPLPICFTLMKCNANHTEIIIQTEVQQSPSHFQSPLQLRILRWFLSTSSTSSTSSRPPVPLLHWDLLKLWTSADVIARHQLLLVGNYKWTRSLHLPPVGSSSLPPILPALIGWAL